MVTDVSLKFANRDGVKLAYLDTGAGDPPLLFVHGWCCNHTYWRDQIPEFAQRHRVVAVDLRGCGESNKPDQDYTIETFRTDAAWLTREIGLQRPVVIGHSMGGQIALQLVRRDPQLARAAVFVDAPMLPFPEEFQPMVASMLEGLRSPAYREVATNFVANFLFRPESPAALKEETIAAMTSAPQRFMHTALTDIGSEQNMAAGPIPVPSLFVRAATLPATEDELKARYPGMEVVTVDAAHFIQNEKPQEFNAILRQFIEKVA